MSSTEDSNPPEFSDSDREWLEALSGKALRDPESLAAREGLAMRAALEQRRKEIDGNPRLAASTGDASMENQRRQLLQRARNEGLFDPPVQQAASPDAVAPSEIIEFPWWRRRRPLLALAASVLMGAMAVNLWLQLPDYAEPPTMLGAGRSLSVRVQQPRAAAERLAADLKEGGLRPGLYQRSQSYFVDIQLMAAELPVAQSIFDRLGIQAAVGFNRVELSPL